MSYSYAEAVKYEKSYNTNNGPVVLKAAIYIYNE